MIKRWLLGLVVAIVAAYVVYGVARATGEEIVVAAGGGEPVAVPPVAIAFATIVGAVGALLVALLLRRVAKPRQTFLIVAVVVLVLSFIQPFTATDTVAAGIWLCVMHVAVAVPLMYFLGQALPVTKKDRAPSVTA